MYVPSLASSMLTHLFRKNETYVECANERAAEYGVQKYLYDIHSINGDALTKLKRIQYNVCDKCRNKTISTQSVLDALNEMRHCVCSDSIQFHKRLLQILNRKIHEEKIQIVTATNYSA